MVVFTRLTFCFILFFWVSNTYAAHEPFPIGARAAGLSGASVTLTDVWAVRNNVAGIASLKALELGVFAENRFNITAFSTVGLQAVFPTKKAGAFGVDCSRFGDQWYNEQRLGIGFAHRLGTVNLGIKADLLQTHLEELGSKKVIAISFGGQSEVVPHLVFGASIFNINQAKLGDYQDERLPTVMRAGLSYQPIKQVQVITEAEKHLEYPVNLKVALEYKLIEKLTLRTGVATATEQFSFGTGFQAKQLQLDYGFGRQSVLGNLHQLAISFKWN
ncbi:PorV/PorQ family protein [Adhaeribacter pallidiroseus]|uniref:PorV/PorQ family protein n=1 Tax=Adhaeribacter pallidiroseus TaxID=2072847 RepID=A0A369QJP5_9BACT|nr:hypothetical protein [Adhaeribacter pallidiroseus]RDC63855.1 hypothetical protein AHMF7616_02464 [Adhaeribacter pallidiroseus]